MHRTEGAKGRSVLGRHGQVAPGSCGGAVRHVLRFGSGLFGHGMHRPPNGAAVSEHELRDKGTREEPVARWQRRNDMRGGEGGSWALMWAQSTGGWRAVASTAHASCAFLGSSRHRHI